MQKIFSKTFLMAKIEEIKKENQLLDFRSSLTAGKVSADVNWWFKANGGSFWKGYCLIFLCTYCFSHILGHLKFVIPKRNTLYIEAEFFLKFHLNFYPYFMRFLGEHFSVDLKKRFQFLIVKLNMDKARMRIQERIYHNVCDDAWLSFLSAVALLSCLGDGSSG